MSPAESLSRKKKAASHSPLRRVRLGMRLTLDEAADGTGLSKTFLHQLEVGKSEPSLTTARTLSKFYGKPIDALFPV